MPIPALSIFYLCPTLLYLVLFVFGLIFGSFFYVVVQRCGQEKKSWLRGRSCCDECGNLIAWFDNLPLFSFIALQGKCRHCQRRISWRYPLAELLTGLIFVFSGYTVFNSVFFQNWPAVMAFFFSLVSVSVLWLILLFDFEQGIIPDELVGLTLALALLRQIILIAGSSFNLNKFVLELILSLVFLLFFVGLRQIPYLLFKKHGIGPGDIKLIAPLSLLLGWPQMLVGVFCAFILGGIWGIILLTLKQKKLGQRIAFGPFLALGFLIALAWGEQLWLWYWQFL